MPLQAATEVQVCVVYEVRVWMMAKIQKLKMQMARLLAAAAVLTGFGAAAGQAAAAVPDGVQRVGGEPVTDESREPRFSARSLVAEVTADPIFADYGRLLFPLQRRYCSGDELGQLQFTYYPPCDPEQTVNIINYLHQRAASGDEVFFPLYSPQEIAAAPELADCGLFFFRGRPGAPTALICAGGAFAFVGAMQDSFPQAWELAARGINALALIYRPGSQSGSADLARAVDFIERNAGRLQLAVDNYAVWGGSAGARLAAFMGRLGPQTLGGQSRRRPAAVIMQYTSYQEVSADDAPTFSVVGERDPIAPWKIMQQRTQRLQQLGVPAAIRIYPGLGHGFGSGAGSVAAGWVDEALHFWLQQPPRS